MRRLDVGMFINFSCLSCHPHLHEEKGASGPAFACVADVSAASKVAPVQGADKRDGPNYFVMVNDFRGMAALLRKLEDKIKQLADSAPR